MKTAVITTGGLGTRLFTITKVLPKTMLPLFEKNPSDLNSPILRPLIEIIFNDLYDAGFRRFCFIVGVKTKRVIIDHFNKNDNFINLLKKRNSSIDKRFVKSLETFDKKIIRLPSKNYIKSLENYLEIKNKSNFKKYKVFDYRINNQLILN